MYVQEEGPEQTAFICTSSQVVATFQLGMIGKALLMKIIHNGKLQTLNSSNIFTDPNIHTCQTIVILVKRTWLFKFGW